MLPVQELDKEIYLRQASRSNFNIFVKYNKEDYIFNWHHKFLCKKYQEFSEGKIKKLMVFAPPQTGKSELNTRMLPAFLVGKNPNLNIAICAYNQTFSSQFNRDIQRIITSDSYRNIFPKTKLNEKNVASDAKGSYLRNSEIFEIVGYKGRVRTPGIGGPITGSPVDVGIIDDPIKGAIEAYSKTYRDRVWDWFQTDFESRLHNNSQQLITLTRWHQDDLAGRILARDSDWEVVVLPAIKEAHHVSDYDPREIGEVLFPQKHSLERYLRIKANNPNVFTSLYQQDPRDKDGEIFKTQHFEVRSLDQIPNEVLSVQSDFAIDTAYTNKSKNDPSGILIYKIYQDTLYIFKWSTYRLEYPQLKEAIINEVDTYGGPYSAVEIEPKANGKSIVQDLKFHTKLNVVESKAPTTDKISRANAITNSLYSKPIILVEGSWNNEYLWEMLSFDKAPHDEAVDCTCIAMDKLRRFNTVIEKKYNRRMVGDMSGPYDYV